MISSAWTSMNRSPDLDGHLVAPDLTVRHHFDDLLELVVQRAPPAAGRSELSRRRARASACSSRAGVHRLQQVVDGVDLERLDGVLVEGGHEHQRRRRRRSRSSRRRATSKPAQARHLDVEEHEVGLVRGRRPPAPRGRCPPAPRLRRRRAARAGSTARRAPAARRRRPGRAERVVHAVICSGGHAVRESRCARACPCPARSSASAGRSRRR